MNSNNIVRVLQVISKNTHGGIFRVQQDLLAVYKNDSKVDLHVLLIPQKDYYGEFDLGLDFLDQTEISGNTINKIFQVRKLIKQFDLIHLHGPLPWLGLALLFTKIKIVYTNHGLLGSGRKLQKHEYLKRFIVKLFLKYKAHKVVNISNYALNRIVNDYKTPLNKCTVVYNSTFWETKSIKFNISSVIKIGYHGRFVSVKRVDRLINVGSIINKNYQVKIELLGDGILKDNYIELAQKLNVDLNIIPYTMNPQEIIENFDIEIIPSSEEYFGLAVIEAILTGIPTFVFEDGGGCTEIFGSKFNWFICRDENDMAYKIMSLNEPHNREHMLKQLVKLRDHVSSTYAIENFSNGYKNVYLKIANGAY